jgi:hypothetical protein
LSVARLRIAASFANEPLQALELCLLLLDQRCLKLDRSLTGSQELIIAPSATLNLILDFEEELVCSQRLKDPCLGSIVGRPF